MQTRFAATVAFRVDRMNHSTQASSGILLGPAILRSVQFCWEFNNSFSFLVMSQDSQHHNVDFETHVSNKRNVLSKVAIPFA